MGKNLTKKEIGNLELEISFCEGLIKDNPDFIEALIILGEAYTKRRLYEKGLNIDKRLSELRPYDPIVTYNLACSYSLTGDIEASLKTLRDAVIKGYWDFDFMRSDPDLENTRKDKRFGELLIEFKNGKGGDINGVWFIQEEEVKGGEEKKAGRKAKGYEKGC